MIIIRPFCTEMQSGCLLQLLLALSPLILSKAQDVIGSGPSCLRSSPADAGETRITFLQEDAAGVRSLFLTLWSGDLRLVTCEVNTDQLVTESYRTLCDRSGTQDEGITQRFNISGLLAPDAPCALVSSSAPTFPRRDGTRGKTRRKRSWYFPGTLWCGTGSRADRYDQLGMFESADRCCREHDHCPHMIPAFKFNYGVFNSKFFTVSHCDCDQRFRECLLRVNDTISNMVGYSFFSILQVPCFELEQQRQCTGMCKVAKEALYAVFRSPRPYNNTDVISKDGDNADSNNLTSSEGQHVTQRPVIKQHTKSPRSEHKCSSNEPPTEDTLYGTKGKGCKRHQKLSTVAPSQIPPISRPHTTTPSMRTRLVNASKGSAVMPNKTRAGKKKSTRKGLSAYSTQSAPPQVTTNSYPQTTSTTQGTPSISQEPTPHLHSPTVNTAMTKTTKSRKKIPKQSPCCGFRVPLRGDTFQPLCKTCKEQNMTTVTPSTTTHGLPIKVTTPETPRHTSTTETTKRDTVRTMGSTATSTTELKTTASIHTVGKPQKQMESHPRWNTTNQKPMGRTKAPNTHVERGWTLNIALHNMTDNQLLCRSLKHLDECKYKIPPLEKKYSLHNKESRSTAYHCDCTSRLAVEIEGFKKPSILPALLMDFVSQRCFKLPKEKKCHGRKSCSGGFTKASDLLRALKKMEQKDTAGVRNSGDDRKRGIPVRLYKRCLRLERKADIMAQLTRL